MVYFLFQLGAFKIRKCVYQYRLSVPSLVLCCSYHLSVCLLSSKHTCSSRRLSVSLLHRASSPAENLTLYSLLYICCTQPSSCHFTVQAIVQRSFPVFYPTPRYISRCFRHKTEGCLRKAQILNSMHSSTELEMGGAQLI